MNLVDLYVSEVGRRLPEKTRTDIEQEIRSMIEDTLEDESKKQQRAVDDEMVKEVLKRLGPPEKLAASYLPPRYLIGPELYSTFIMVTRIVITIILVLGIIELGFSFGLSNLPATQIGEAVLGAIGNLFNSAIVAFGWIVITFAIIQVVANHKDLKIKQQDWDPGKLKNVRKREDFKFKPVEIAIDVVLTIVVLVLFNAYPQYVGIGNIRDGQVIFVSVLAPAFFIYLPWITLLWALKASVGIAALGQGRWLPWMRWALVGIGCGLIILAYRMMTGPDLLTFSQDAFSQLGWGLATGWSYQEFVAQVNQLVRLVIGIAMAIQVIDVAVNLYRLVLRAQLRAVIRFQG